MFPIKKSFMQHPQFLGQFGGQTPEEKNQENDLSLCSFGVLECEFVYLNRGIDSSFQSSQEAINTVKYMYSVHQQNKIYIA